MPPAQNIHLARLVSDLKRLNQTDVTQRDVYWTARLADNVADRLEVARAKYEAPGSEFRLKPPFDSVAKAVASQPDLLRPGRASSPVDHRFFGRTQWSGQSYLPTVQTINARDDVAGLFRMVNAFNIGEPILALTGLKTIALSSANFWQLGTSIALAADNAWLENLVKLMGPTRAAHFVGSGDVVFPGIVSAAHVRVASDTNFDRVAHQLWSDPQLMTAADRTITLAVLTGIERLSANGTAILAQSLHDLSEGNVRRAAARLIDGVDKKRLSSNGRISQASEELRRTEAELRFNPPQLAHAVNIDAPESGGPARRHNANSKQPEALAYTDEQLATFEQERAILQGRYVRMRNDPSFGRQNRQDLLTAIGDNFVRRLAAELIAAGHADYHFVLRSFKAPTTKMQRDFTMHRNHRNPLIDTAENISATLYDFVLAVDAQPSLRDIRGLESFIFARFLETLEWQSESWLAGNTTAPTAPLKEGLEEILLLQIDEEPHVATAVRALFALRIQQLSAQDAADGLVTNLVRPDVSVHAHRIISASGKSDLPAIIFNGDEAHPGLRVAQFAVQSTNLALPALRRFFGTNQQADDLVARVDRAIDLAVDYKVHTQEFADEISNLHKAAGELRSVQLLIVPKFLMMPNGKKPSGPVADSIITTPSDKNSPPVAPASKAEEKALARLTKILPNHYLALFKRTANVRNGVYPFELIKVTAVEDGALVGTSYPAERKVISLDLDEGDEARNNLTEIARWIKGTGDTIAIDLGRPDYLETSRVRIYNVVNDETVTARMNSLGYSAHMPPTLGLD